MAMTEEEAIRERLRDKVAVEHAFQLYRRYSEKAAAKQVGCNYSTLKRKRRAGLVPYLDLGHGSVAYMGYHIADMILFGVNARREGKTDGAYQWPNTQGATTGSVSGGSVNAADRPPTTASATIPQSKAMSALALARRSLR